MIFIENAFSIGQTVYLRTDGDQLPRIVTAIRIFGSKHELLYNCTQGSGESQHFDFELAAERNAVAILD